MYRRTIYGQQKLEIPFGVNLDASNRWVKLTSLMPWDKIDSEYSKHFSGANGQEAKPSRLAFAALYIQNRLKITDEETVNQIRENPFMQYFCGFESYSTEPPFDSSLMVHFRKRISAEMMKRISEEAFASEALKAIEKESRDDDDTDGSSTGSARTDEICGAEATKPKGTLQLDATCCPSDIKFPTDINLLNHARELTETMIDLLHECFKGQASAKMRTYREVARKAYLAFAKMRKFTHEQLRNAISQQLQYVCRNLDSIAKMVELGADLGCLGKELHRKLLVISELYRQQKLMYDEKTNKIEDRIVSISQPHLRPIVRGKARTPVEFGAKIATAHIGGFSFVIHLAYDNFSEAKYLEAATEEYKRMFGFYPKVIIGDKAYGTLDNRRYCKTKGIRLSAPKLGRKSEEEKESERKQLYEDNCRRNAIEGSYGTGKRKYGLDLIMTKLFDTTLAAISFKFFVKNMERILRILVLRTFYKWHLTVDCARKIFYIRSQQPC